MNQQHHLENIPKSVGAEIDVRVWQDELVLAHEPFKIGEDIENYLKNYAHSTLIFNIKCEQIEYRILELVQKYQITDYFFLDSSIPMMNKLADKYSDHLAVRFSEFEPIEQLRLFSSRAKWVWVDCFNRFILTQDHTVEMKKLGFKICLVCPSLQGRPQDIQSHIDKIKSEKIQIDAVCSKLDYQSLWLTL